jgi:peptidoglycan-associated lipoprotein
MIRKFVFASVALVLSIFIFGQKNYTQLADEKFQLNKYYEAIELYKKAYTKVSNKVEKNRILYNIGLSYYKMGDTKNASQYLKRVIKAGYPEADAYYYYGECLRSLEKYEDAIVVFQEMKQKFPNDQRADFGIEGSKLAKAWMDNPTQYQVEVDKKINSKAMDFAPAWYDKKHRSIVFTTTREEVQGKGTDAWTGEAFSDLFVTTQDKKGNWSTPVPIDEEGVINTPDNEGACVMNSKYNTIYFTRCKKEKKKILGCQIYMSTKKGKSWSEPELINITSDSTVSVRHPAINNEETMLIFSSNMPGGQGGFDLWMVTRQKKNKPFENPVNLGPVINTPGDEAFPTLREVNGRTFLYFASTGHLGMGGLDIFVSEYVDGKWTEPQNMKYPINSSADDFHIIFDDDPNDLAANKAKEMGWFSSNRKGGKGKDDLWRFYLPPLLLHYQALSMTTALNKLYLKLK